MNESCASDSNTGNKFKQISLGPKAVKIPSEWKVRFIKDLTVDEKFAIVDGPFGTQLHADEYVSEGYPLVRISNLSFNGKFIPDKLAFVREEKIRELNRSKIVPGDIIIAKTGATIGKNAIFPDDFDKGLIASSCLKISIDQNLSNTKFVHYWINSTFGQDLIDLYSSGTTRKSINIEPFGKIKIPNPPLAEQRRIAEILSTVDEQIQQTDKIIEETKALKHGLMQDLLIRGIGHDCFKQVYFGPESAEIPAPWDVVKLGDVVDQYRGGASLSSNDFTDDGIPVIPKGGINQRGVLRIPEEDQQYCSNEYAHSNKSSLVSEGDLVTVSRDLVSSAPNIGRVVEVPDREYIISQGVNAMEINDDQLNPQYLIYLSNSHLYRNHMKRIKVGSTQVHIRKDDFLSTPIPCPPIEEQREIVDVLSAAEQQIREEIDRKSKLQELKRGFMQDLLTGKVRVPVET